MSKLQKYLPLLLSIFVLLGVIFGMRLQTTLENKGYFIKSTKDNERSIDEAIQHIRSKYYGEIDYKDFTDQVLINIVDQLDDYSHYFEASSDTLYHHYIKGLYNGVGIEFAEFKDSFYISAVVTDSPADQAGIRPGDRIIKIEDVIVDDQGISRDSILSLSDLAEGDTLDITVSHATSSQEISLAVEVSNIDLTLLHDYIIYGDVEVSYIKIDRFYDGVFKDFMDALDRQKHDSSTVSNLIIDLRNNPGGVVEETVKILNQLVNEKDKLLLTTVNSQDRKKTYTSNGRGFLNIERIVVIINNRSASASEILAAALQDYDKAVIVGDNSYGKGVIQQNYQFSNEGSMNLTVGAYILPSGRMITRNETSDSTFYTIKNKREILITGPGVTPDLKIDKCPLEFRRSSMTRFFINEQVWSHQEFESFSPDDKNLALAKVYNLTTGDTCHLSAASHFNWYLYTEWAPMGSRVGPEYLDLEIKQAADIILSDQYYQILETNN